MQYTLDTTKISSQAIIIVGAGEIAYDIIHQLRAEKKEAMIRAVCTTKKHASNNQFIHGIRILTLSQAINKADAQVEYLIASVAFYEQIKQSLLKEGIASNRILAPIRTDRITSFCWERASLSTLNKIRIASTSLNKKEYEELMRDIAFYLPLAEHEQIEHFWIKDDPTGIKGNIFNDDDVYLVANKEAGKKIARSGSKATYINFYPSHNASQIRFSRLTNGAFLQFLVSTPEELRSINKNSQASLKNLCSTSSIKQRAVLYGCGPSLANGLGWASNQGFDNDSSLKIACNWLASDIKLLHTIMPDVYALIDPFFFSTDNKARQIMGALLDYITSRDKTWLIAPEFAGPLILAHYPKLAHHLILIGFDSCASLATMESLTVELSSSPNVLSSCMLPLASYLSADIILIGFDGKPMNSIYHWDNSSLVSSLPSDPVARVDKGGGRGSAVMDIYYKHHCDIIEETISAIEDNGAKVTSGTHSFIPALSRRIRRE